MAMAHLARSCGSDAAKAHHVMAAALGGQPRAAGSLPGVSGELLDDRTVRPIITTASDNKMLERSTHGVQRSFTLAKVNYSSRRQRLYIRTGASPIAPQRQKLTDFVDWKAKVASPGNEAQSMDVTGRVIPILRVTSESLRGQADFLVVAHHTRAETRRRCRLANVHKLPLDLDTMSTPTLRRDA